MRFNQRSGTMYASVSVWRAKARTMWARSRGSVVIECTT